jgi:hypothetical protein
VRRIWSMPRVRTPTPVCASASSTILRASSRRPCRRASEAELVPDLVGNVGDQPFVERARGVELSSLHGEQRLGAADLRIAGLELERLVEQRLGVGDVAARRDDGRDPAQALRLARCLLAAALEVLAGEGTFVEEEQGPAASGERPVRPGDSRAPGRRLRAPTRSFVEQAPRRLEAIRRCLRRAREEEPADHGSPRP